MDIVHEFSIEKTKLISYERTREEAIAVARDHERETNQKCLVANPSGIRARHKTSDKPWQVREYCI